MAEGIIPEPNFKISNTVSKLWGAPFFGYLTSASTELFIFVLLPNSAVGKTISNLSVDTGQYRISTGGYIYPTNTDVTAYSNGGLYLKITFKNNNGYSTENNILVAGTVDVSLTIS